MNLKCAIVDDEPLALNLLESYINKTPFLELAGKYSSAVQAMSDLPDKRVDLLFLDIQMPELNGLEFSRMVDTHTRIVFTTAFDQYAIDGYRVNALDYLLKPIGRKDVEQALEKLSLFSSNTSRPAGLETDELLKLIRSLKKQESYKTHFLIPVKGDKLLPVSVDMIMLFYIKDCQVKAVLTDNTEYSFPQTLDELTECLDPALFFRANRQYLLSREAIKDIDLWFNSRLSINLRHPVAGEKILVSKARVAEFKEWFCVK